MKKIFLLLLLLPFIAATAAKAETIPKTAEKYRAELVRAARYEWGMNAPIAVFAAQIHTESLWNERAISPAGAVGLTQFMPETAAWLPNVMPQIGKADPYNPKWAIRALCAYNRYLYQKIKANSEFERMAFTLAAYNGGIGWVIKDKNKAKSQGLDPFQYFGSVEKVNAGRGKAFFRENRRYPKIILKHRQYLYESWGGILKP